MKKLGLMLGIIATFAAQNFCFSASPLSKVSVDLVILSAESAQPPKVIPNALQSDGAHLMPAHPEVVKRLRAEGKLPAIASLQRQWRRFGIDRPAARLRGPVVGNWKAVCILVDFSDKAANAVSTRSFYDTLLFSKGTRPGGSMRDFYLENSFNKLDWTGEVAGWFRAPKNYSDYAGNMYGFGPYPNNAQGLVEDAVSLADPTVNFANYDNNGDGYVEALIVVHAGPGAEATGNPADIWSHKWNIPFPKSVDGVYVYEYTMMPEYILTAGDTTIGVYCHELGHALGLPDLYDVDYSSAGAGDWTVMASGSWLQYLGESPAHFDAWSKVFLGWVDPEVIDLNILGKQIPQVESNPVILRLWQDGLKEKEYFLVENRQNVAFDRFLPGNGLLVWHIDEAIIEKYWDWNEVNAHEEEHYGVHLMQADGNRDLETGNNSGDTGDPFPGATNKRIFAYATNPSSKRWDGTTSYVALMNISNSAATMTADIYVLSFYVRMISPKGGERWAGGANRSIVWTATGGKAPYTVTLSYSTDGGATYPNIIAQGNLSSPYSWIVPKIDSDTVKVKVEVSDSSVPPRTDEDTSADVFSIDSTPPTVSPPPDTKATIRTLSVVFSEETQPLSSQAIANYALESPIGTSVNLRGKTASYDSVTRTVTISGLNLTGGQTFKVTVSGVLDLAGNMIKADGIGNVAQGTVIGPNLTLSKAVDKSEALVGETLKYTLTYGNIGTAEATQTKIEDVLPDNTTLVEGSITGPGTYEAASRKITWDIGTLSAGTVDQKVEFQVTINPDTVGGTKIINRASILCGELVTETWSNPVETMANAVSPSISKTANKAFIAPGNRIKYCLSYGNSGNWGATDVVIEEPIPPNTTYVSGSATGGGVYDETNKKITWNIGTLAPKTSALKVYFEVLVDPGAPIGTQIKNTATLRCAEVATVTSNEVQVGIADVQLEISKAVDKATAAVGDILTYTITYGNKGISSASKVVIEDTIPEKTHFESATKGGTYDATTRTVTWKFDILAGNTAGETVTCRVIVGSDAPVGLALENKARIQSDEVTSPLESAKVSTKVIKREVFAKGVRMVAIPYYLDDPDPGSLFGPPAKWKWAKYKPGDSPPYHEYSPQTPDPFLRIKPGQSYWLLLDEDKSLDLRGSPTPQDLQDPKYPVIHLLPGGWNQIGNPFEEEVAWSWDNIKVRVTGKPEMTLKEAADQGILQNFAWGWKQNEGDPEQYVLIYDPNYAPLAPKTFFYPNLKPWAGYWIMARDECDLILPPPGATKAKKITRQSEIESGKSGWAVQLTALAGNLQDSSNLFGVNSESLSIDNPPRAVKRGYVDLYFLSQGKPLAIDLRLPLSNKQIWDLVVETDLPKTDITVAWSNLSLVPRNCRLILIDQETGKRQYMRTTSSYTFRSEEWGARRKFRIETELADLHRLRIYDLVVLRTRGTVSISYKLSAPASVEVKIYSLTGRLLRTLSSAQVRVAGINSQTWDMRDAQGVVVPNGSYLCQVVARDEEGQSVKLSRPFLLIK